MRKIQYALVACFIVIFLLQCYYVNDDLSGILRMLDNYAEFIENSIKLEYYIDEYDANSIQDIIRTKYNIVDETSNCVEFNDNKLYGRCNIYNLRNRYKVTIELVNKSKEYKLSDLKKEVTELQVNNSYNDKYYVYQKERINNEKGVQEVLNKKIINKETLEIHNGYVGKGQLIDGEKVNYAIVNYKTGGYIIIGTPMIFATY